MALRKAFTYGGVMSADYEIYVLSKDEERTTVKEYDTISVPGKSGDLHIDKKRFSDIGVTYNCAIPATYAIYAFRELIAIILSKGASQRIEDTIDPEYYRMGTLVDAVEPRVSRERDLFVFPLRFVCAPQRWLKEGEEATAVASSVQMYNPTPFTSKPLIHVTGTGTITIGSDVITVGANGGHLIIDCETEDAYDAETLLSYNDKVTISGNSFPGLAPRTNNIAVTGCTINIVPRWWTL